MREESHPYTLWGTSPTRSQKTSQSRPAKGRADTRWHHFSALNSSNCNDSKSLRNWHRAFLRNLKSLLSSMQDYLLSCKETRRKRQTSSATYPCIEADWGQQVWGRRHLLFLITQNIAMFAMFFAKSCNTFQPTNVGFFSLLDVAPPHWVRLTFF